MCFPGLFLFFFGQQMKQNFPTIQKNDNKYYNINNNDNDDVLNNDHNHNDLSAFSCEVNEKFLEFPKNYDLWKK